MIVLNFYGSSFGHRVQQYFLLAKPRALLVALTLLSCSLLVACDSAPEFASTDITGADYGKDFALTDHTGKARALGDFRGKAVVLFFGYTQCPDVCPTVMTTMAQVMKLLGDEGKKLQVLFVTIDPERDTPELLAQYAPAFDPSFLGLYGDAQATARAAQTFRVFYQKQPGSMAATYTIDHTAGSYVFDPKGRLRLYVRHGEKPQAIAGDIRQLLAGK